MWAETRVSSLRVFSTRSSGVSHTFKYAFQTCMIHPCPLLFFPHTTPSRFFFLLPSELGFRHCFFFKKSLSVSLSARNCHLPAVSVSRCSPRRRRPLLTRAFVHVFTCRFWSAARDTERRRSNPSQPVIWLLLPYLLLRLAYHARF